MLVSTTEPVVFAVCQITFKPSEMSKKHGFQENALNSTYEFFMPA